MYFLPPHWMRMIRSLSLISSTGRAVVGRYLFVFDEPGEQVDSSDLAAVAARCRANSSTYLICPPVSASRPSSRFSARKQAVDAEHLDIR
jgi:hypothetical protein